MCRSSPKQEGTGKTDSVPSGKSHLLFYPVGVVSHPSPHPPELLRLRAKRRQGWWPQGQRCPRCLLALSSSFMGGNMEITVVLNITATNRLLQDEKTGLPTFKSEGCEIILVSVKTNLPSK